MKIEMSASQRLVFKVPFPAAKIGHDHPIGPNELENDKL
jgi:hypothetical protein